MIICSVVSLSAMVLTYKMSQTTSNITKTCNKCTNFIKTIKATTQFVVFLFVHSWEQRKAKELFNSTADKGYPELPVLSATQDRGMIRRDENSINVFHDKKNELGYKRVLSGQFVIHLRSFQGGFAHSTIEGITSPAYTIFGISEPEKHDSEYWKYVFTSKEFIRRLETVTYGIRDGRSISYDEFLTLDFVYPSKAEQITIARSLDKLSNLITLHQCECLGNSHALSILPCPLSSRKMTSFWEQRKLWQLTIWDKKFNGVESYKQVKVIKYPYVLADVFSQIEDTSGTVRLLSTGSYIGYTTKEKAGNNLCYGEIVAIPWGGVANIKYYNGFFVTADNRIATSSNTQVLSNRYLHWWMESNITQIQSTYRGASIQHPSMNDILSLSIYLPSIEEQEKISNKLDTLDNLITLHQCKDFSLKSVFEESKNFISALRKNTSWEQRKVSDMFKVTRGYVLAATLTAGTKSEKMPYPVYSSQTKDLGLMGYYNDYLYEDSITWTTDGANAGTVNYRAGKFYCTNVCGVLLSDKIMASQMIAEALNNVAKGYVSYVGNPKLMNNVMADISIMIPVSPLEQRIISEMFAKIDNLITLHQRIKINITGDYHDKKDK